MPEEFYIGKFIEAGPDTPGEWIVVAGAHQAGEFGLPVGIQLQVDQETAVVTFAPSRPMTYHVHRMSEPSDPVTVSPPIPVPEPGLELALFWGAILVGTFHAKRNRRARR